MIELMELFGGPTSWCHCWVHFSFCYAKNDLHGNQINILSVYIFFTSFIVIITN